MLLGSQEFLRHYQRTNTTMWYYYYCYDYEMGHTFPTFKKRVLLEPAGERSKPVKEKQKTKKTFSKEKSIKT